MVKIVLKKLDNGLGYRILLNNYIRNNRRNSIYGLYISNLLGYIYKDSNGYKVAIDMSLFNYWMIRKVVYTDSFRRVIPLIYSFYI